MSRGRNTESGGAQGGRRATEAAPGFSATREGPLVGPAEGHGGARAHAWQPIQSRAPWNPIHASVGNPDGMVAFEAPHAPNRTQVISSVPMQNLFHHFGGCLVRHLMRYWLLPNETLLSTCPIREVFPNLRTENPGS